MTRNCAPLSGGSETTPPSYELPHSPQKKEASSTTTDSVKGKMAIAEAEGRLPVPNYIQKLFTGISDLVQKVIHTHTRTFGIEDNQKRIEKCLSSMRQNFHRLYEQISQNKP